MGFISFNEVGLSKSGKTKIFRLYSNGVDLGTVKFYSPWRKYCFFPVEYTLLDYKCLIEIADFMKSETDKIFGR